MRISMTIAVVMDVIVYRELPKCRSWNCGWCDKCGNYPNSTRLVETNEGTREIVQCSVCGHQMRPYSSEEESARPT